MIREIPYRQTVEIRKLEKRINAYISLKPDGYDIELYPSIFDVFLRHISVDRQTHFAKVGIPFGAKGEYTLKVKR